MGNPARVCVHVCVREKQRERQDTEWWLIGAGEESGSRCVRLCCCKNSHPCKGNHGAISSSPSVDLTLSQCCSADVISTTDSGMSTLNGW